MVGQFFDKVNLCNTRVHYSIIFFFYRVTFTYKSIHHTQINFVYTLYLSKIV